MQNAIAPVTPATPSSPVESRPSPRAPNSHAFATLLRQSQNPAPAPAKAAPVPLAKIDGTIGASAPSASAKAASAAATSAADAARADDARADAGSAESRTADNHTDDNDVATTRADKDDTPTTDGTGMPLSHGLVATHRLAAATVEKGVSDNAERATRISTTSLGARADAGAAATSSNPSTTSSTSLAPRGADTTRQDETRSIARFAAGTGDKIAIPGAGTSPEIGKTMPFAPSALRTEAMSAPTGLSTLDPAQSGPTSSVDATVATPPTSPDFAQAFAVQVSVLVQDGVHSAELHLNPVETGPVSVRIVVEGSQARIDFGADALATRQAIEAGLPELASALRDAGFTLQGGGVSQHARDPNGDAGSGDGSAARRGPSGSDETRAAPVSRQRIVTAGGVDLYA